MGGQFLCFTNPASYAITNDASFNESVTNSFNASGGTVTYVGNDYRAQRSIWIGTVPGATATVDFVKGAIWAPYGHIYVGRDGGRGHMRMYGEMGRISTYYSVEIGKGSDGSTLEVRDGACLDNLDQGNSLRVGAGGSGNSLLITAGGTVTNLHYFYVGGQGGDSNSNRVVVADAGSSLILDGSRNNWIGHYGRYNEMIVTNGSLVRVLEGNTGVVVGQYGYNTRLVVTGSGSLLDCAGPLMMSGEHFRTGNCVDVLDGGRAKMASLRITGAHGNRVTVAGAGSLLRTGEALVGVRTNSTSSANMTVLNGACVETEVFTVGPEAKTDNQVQVDHAVLAATNASFTGRLEIRSGSVSLTNGATLTADSLCITNTAAATCRLTATIGGTSAGVALTRSDPSALDLTVPGCVKIVFAAEPAEELEALWGFWVPGNQTARLSGLIADGLITCDTTALSDTARRRFGAHYDAASDTSYIGVQGRVLGTLLSVR